jgi:hypothetical protein
LYFFFQFVSQLSQYLLPEQAWAVIKDVLGGIKDSLPTEELKEFISAVEAYVEKVRVHTSESTA